MIIYINNDIFICTIKNIELLKNVQNGTPDRRPCVIKLIRPLLRPKSKLTKSVLSLNFDFETA